MDWVSKMVDKFRALSQEEKENILKMTLWIAAAGPLLMIIGNLTIAVGALALVIPKVGAALTLLAAHPMVLLAAGIAVVIKLVWEAVKAFEAWGKAKTKEQKSVEGLAWQEKNMEAQFGTKNLENIKEQNRERWAGEKRMIALRERYNAVFKKLGAAAPGQKLIPKKPIEINLEAQAKYQDKLQKALFEQMNTEEKINKLIQKRADIQKEIDAAQKGSEEFFAAKERALATEVQLKSLLDEKGRKLQEGMASAKTEKKFAAAVEAGSVEAYRLKIGAKHEDAVAKHTKKMNEQMDELNDTAKEELALLAAALGEPAKIMVIA